MSVKSKSTRGIRPACPSDAARLSALAFQSKAHWGYSIEFMAACRAELSFSPRDLERDAYYLLIEGLGDQQDMIGFYGLSEITPEQTRAGRLELAAMFVTPEKIGSGAGRQMIEHAKGAARRLGACELIVQSDPHAAEFYQACGGIRIGERESGSISGRYLPLLSIALIQAQPHQQSVSP